MMKQLVVFTAVLLALASSSPVFKCATFGLKSTHGKYLSAQSNGDVQWDRSAYGSWETIRWEQSGSNPDKGSFKSTHGKYLCAESNNKLKWNRGAIGGWEVFTIVQRGDKVAIKTAHGRYLSAQDDGSVDADRTKIQSWELFTVYPPTCLRCQCAGTITTTDYTSTKVQYNLSQGTVVKQPPQRVASQIIDNKDSAAQQSSQFSASVAVTNSRTFTSTFGTSVMVGAEFTAKVPFVGEATGKIEVTASASFEQGVAQSTTNTISAVYNCVAPAGAKVVCKAVLLEYVMTVPYTQTWKHKRSGCECQSHGVFVGTKASEMRLEIDQSE